MMIFHYVNQSGMCNVLFNKMWIPKACREFTCRDLPGIWAWWVIGKWKGPTGWGYGGRHRSPSPLSNKLSTAFCILPCSSLGIRVDWWSVVLMWHVNVEVLKLFVPALNVFSHFIYNFLFQSAVVIYNKTQWLSPFNFYITSCFRV